MMNKAKILFIEDELTFAKMVKLRLEHEGFQINIAYDAYEGTNLVLNEDYDLVILDLMMPLGGGKVVLERMRANRKTETVPVIILTGMMLNKELKELIQKFNVAAFFNKPLHIFSMLGSIRKTLC